MVSFSFHDSRRRPWPALPLAVALLALAPGAGQAQTLEDGGLVPRRTLGAGVVYGHDRWTQYWEGTLKRSNDNIGRLTTRSVTWMLGYGVTRNLSVMAMIPYVRTEASQGVLHSMEGVQDLTVGAKYRVLRAPLTEHGTLSAIVAGAYATPASSYTPDFLPLSIGLASRQASGRFTVDFQAHDGWWLTGSAGYVWRGKVTLDRPAYYTNGRLFLSDEVEMPAVADYRIGAGFRRGRLEIPVTLVQQRTLGGGDIRRHDMPFVSNRMNFVRIDGGVRIALPAPRDLGLHVGYSRTLSGRNVGDATAVRVGLQYMFPF